MLAQRLTRNRQPVAVRRGRRALAVTALLLASCAGPVEPRWAAPAPSASVDIFESPRQTLVLEDSPDIGELRFDGVVRPATVTPVRAANDGRVVEVFVDAGERVNQGDAIVRFQPAQTRSAELEREILQLERELADELGDDNAIDEVDRALAALEQEELDSAMTIAAPVAGIVLGVAAGITSSVSAESEVFAIATSDDVVVTVDTGVEQVEGLGVGDAVTARTSVVGARARAALITAIDPFDSDTDRVMLTIELDEPFTVDELGEAVAVDVNLTPDLSNDAVSNVWVDRRLVHRLDGESFLLAEDSAGQLERLDVRFGRRTTTHIEVRDIASISSLTPGRVLVLP